MCVMTSFCWIPAFSAGEWGLTPSTSMGYVSAIGRDRTSTGQELASIVHTYIYIYLIALTASC